MSQRPVVLGPEFTFNTRESLWLRSEGPFLVRVALQWDPNEPFDQNCISWPTPNPVLSQLRHHWHKNIQTQHSRDKHKQYTLLSHCKTTDTEMEDILWHVKPLLSSDMGMKRVATPTNHSPSFGSSPYTHDSCPKEERRRAGCFPSKKTLCLNPSLDSSKHWTGKQLN